MTKTQKESTATFDPVQHAKSLGYSDEELRDVPEGVVCHGCGNPIGLADLKDGETVLDLGSGGGLDAFLAAKRVGLMGRVIGVDESAETVAAAIANSARGSYKNVIFKVGPMEHLPVESEAVDVAISNCVINHAAEKVAVFRELFRCLRPNGRIIVADLMAEGQFSPEAMQDKVWGDWLAHASGKQAYSEAIRKAGFKDVVEVHHRHLAEFHARRSVGRLHSLPPDPPLDEILIRLQVQHRRDAHVGLQVVDVRLVPGARTDEQMRQYFIEVHVRFFLPVRARGEGIDVHGRKAAKPECLATGRTTAYDKGTMSTTVIVLLIVFGVILLVGVVVGFVLLILFLLSKGGWGRLRGRYSTLNQPTGQIVQRQTVKIGVVTYKRCVAVGIADEGLYLAIWRKTVLIPWTEFKGIGQTMLYWQRVPVLTVGSPPVTTITVQNDLFEMMQGRWTG